MAKSRSRNQPSPSLALVPAVERSIFKIRGSNVMLDEDLAKLYAVPTKRLNEQVRRNLSRFPPDFMFRLTRLEATALRSHFATSNAGRGGRRYLPLAFTEQGVAMLSSVLHSDRAIQVNIGIVRTFVRLREMLATHRGLAERMEALERKCETRFEAVFRVIRRLMAPPVRRRRPIGFVPPSSATSSSSARASAAGSGRSS
jgi:hypothetical protein